MKTIVNSINFKKLYFQNRQYTPESLDCLIQSVTKHLEKNYHSNSPFIVLTAYNHIKTIIAYYAILKFGKIAVILDPQAKNFDITEIIDDTEPGALFILNTENYDFQFDEEIIFRTSAKNYILSSEIKDVCTIAYTNAEDGFLKGAMLSEKNLLSEVEAIVQSNNLTQASVTYSLLPFHHMFGLVQGVLISTLTGCTSLIVEVDLFKLVAIAKQIKCVGVTHLYSVPSVFYMLSKIEGINEYFEHVKFIVSGGNKLSPFIFNAFYKKAKKHIREGYGLTETSPACVLHYEDEIPQVESLGTPLPGTNIKVVDVNGNDCAIGDVGEIMIKGNLVFQGYLNKPEITEKVMKGDWLHTGDYGKLDSKGYVYFEGLKKDMVNVAGNNVYPSRLIRLLENHPNVEKASITAQESVLQGHTIDAYIKLTNNATDKQKEFKEWCKENITHVSLPKSWHFE